MTFISRRKTFDVCIVGSGAGGGMVAHELTKAGADVVMLEAGEDYESIIRVPFKMIEIVE